jgi:histidinol-phosphate phosphatase family protein
LSRAARTSTSRFRDVGAVVFDRDETLIVDVPFNGDPQRVKFEFGVRGALDRLRAAGLPLAVVSNQSGVGRGYITLEQVYAVNRRVDAVLGPFAGFFVCPHAPDDGCDCRKPQPRLILDAARAMHVEPERCVVIGDRDSDVEAAVRARAIPLKIQGPRELPAAVDAILKERET